jgi:hypothetical protein
MDLSTLSDAELDALQLAVNVEIGERLQKTRMMDRLVEVMGSAASRGVSDEAIATSFEEAKTRAGIRYERPAEVARPVAPDTTSATLSSRRTSSGFRTNIIVQ